MIETNKIGEPKRMFFMPETTDSGIITQGGGLVNDAGNLIKVTEDNFNKMYQEKKEKIKTYNKSIYNITDERILKIENSNGFIIRMFVREQGTSSLILDDTKYIVNIHKGTARPDDDDIPCPLQYSDVGVINVLPKGETDFKVGDIVQVYNSFYEDARSYVAINYIPNLVHPSFYRPHPKNKSLSVAVDYNDPDFGYVRLKHHELICKVGSIYDK